MTLLIMMPRAAVSSDSNRMTRLMRIEAAGDTVERYLCISVITACNLH